MSGHSKWATTKRAKAVVDAKRGAIFTKIAKLITIAARAGGEPVSNFSLRMAIDKAKAVNMPKDNIERAIKRGTGEGGEAQIEELTYEGMGPAKAQFIVKALSDNKNRTAAEIRHLFAEAGGSLGAVMWNFESKAVIRVEHEELKNKNLSHDENFELELIDAGAQDIIKEEEGMTIYAKPEDLRNLKNLLEGRNIATASAGIEYIAKDQLELSGEDKEKIQAFINQLEDNEDVSEYYTNVA
ncbi:MAG: YebC/PmpR family DNA-binding transcriptional regulator [bacterium]|nr:YebC/PmpR family DNA-binding transcriptional regulator [bacterium]